MNALPLRRKIKFDLNVIAAFSRKGGVGGIVNVWHCVLESWFTVCLDSKKGPQVQTN
jgi:hypothetical protein